MGGAGGAQEENVSIVARIVSIVLSIGCGMSFAIAIAIGEYAGEVLGHGIRSALVSFVVSTFMIAIKQRFSEGTISIAGIEKIRPRWQVALQGFLGCGFLVFTILLVPQLGFAVTFVFIVVGQLLTALVVDHFALFGSEQRSATIFKVFAMCVLIAGAVLIRGFSTDLHPGLLVLYIILALGTATLSPFQALSLRDIAGQIGQPTRATLISFLSGDCFLLTASLVTLAFTPLTYKDATWWMWFGGVADAIFVFSFSVLPAKIGNGPFFLCIVFGQLGTALALDATGFLGGHKKDVTALQLIGFGLAVLGVAGFQIAVHREEQRRRELLKKEREAEMADRAAGGGAGADGMDGVHIANIEHLKHHRHPVELQFELESPQTPTSPAPEGAPTLRVET